jgi:hypothetical protein
MYLKAIIFPNFICASLSLPEIQKNKNLNHVFRALFKKVSALTFTC